MYIDIVLCKHPGDPRFFLYQAPPFSGIKKGETVIVEVPDLISDERFTADHETAEVVNVITLDTDSEELKFIMDWCNTKKLEKIVKRVRYIDLDYGDEI